jgi:predicted phosphate transport protein (TIGR00153 family)
MFSLLPKEEQFFDLLENAAANAVKSVEAFKRLIDSWNPAAHELFTAVRDIEHEGDMLTHEVIDKLNRTFVTPIDREDIYALIGQIDDVCDILQALSDRMQLYDLGVHMPDSMKRMSDLLIHSGHEMANAVKAFHNFRHNSRVQDHCIKIKGIENAADDLLKHALAELFKTGDPMRVIKWKEIYESVENAHDKIAQIANTLEGVMVKNA